MEVSGIALVAAKSAMVHTDKLALAAMLVAAAMILSFIKESLMISPIN